MTRSCRPAPRGKVLRDLRCLSVEIRQLPVVTPSVNDPAAAAIVPNQLADTNDPAAAASVVQHQLTGTHHGAQSDTVFLPVFPHNRANRYSEIDHTARFQPYRSPASALSRSTEVPGPTRVEDAPSSIDSLSPQLLSQGPETNELPQLEPLTDAQEIEMLQLLLTDDQRQTMENDVHQSSSQPLSHPTSYNLPSNLLLCWALPLFVTTNHTPSHFTSWQFGHLHHSPQIELLQADLGRNMHVAAQRPPERSAPFNFFLNGLSYAIPHPAAYSTTASPSVILVVVQAAPEMNSTIDRMVEEPSAFNIMLQQHPPANTALPTTTCHAPPRSTNSDSTHQATSPATARRGGGRGRGNRQPLQRRVATGERRRKVAEYAPVPTTAAAAAATVEIEGQRSHAEDTLSRLASQRQIHLLRLSERRRRNKMNQMVESGRILFTPAESKETR